MITKRLAFATRFEPRTWAIEGAGGLGALLAQKLVAAGETVLDVPPTLSAGVRLLDSTRTDKTDSHDARAAAIVAMRHGRLRRVAPVDHSAVLRLLADRHHDLTALRTQAICRLHALLCQVTSGGASGRLSAQRAGQILRGIGPLEPVATERKRIALDLLGDVRRFDSQLVAFNERIAQAVLASGTTLTRRSRRRRPGRGDHPRPHRRHHPVPRRRPLRPLQRHRTHRRVVRAERPAPTQPTREPPTPPGHPRRRRHPDRPRHRRTHLLPAQAGNGHERRPTGGHLTTQDRWYDR